jgi:adenylate cyclase
MSWVIKLRLVTGLVIALYLALHFINHMLGLFSFAAMDAYREVMSVFWRSWPLTILLHGSLITHFALALRAVYMKTTLRMPKWEWTQLIIAIIAAPGLLGHVLGTRISDYILGVQSNGHATMYAILDGQRSLASINMTMTVVLVWIHVAVGLHFWLRLKSWYRKSVAFFFALIVLLPTLGLLGFFRSWLWMDGLPEAARKTALGEVMAGPSYHYPLMYWGGRVGAPFLCFGLFGLAFFLRWNRLRRLKSKGGFKIDHSARGIISSLPGRTILEGLRDAGVPHASVCGGRGRCTTCRVHIDRGLEDLDTPSHMEEDALARVTADPHVRLACLVRHPHVGRHRHRA